MASKVDLFHRAVTARARRFASVVFGVGLSAGVFSAACSSDEQAAVGADGGGTGGNSTSSGGASLGGTQGGGVPGGGGSSQAGGAGSSSAGGRSGAAGSGGASASGGSPSAGGTSSGGTTSAGGQDGGGNVPSSGLRVVGNEILAPDGKPFHGRGANLNDTRSCNACAYAAADVDGLNRWSDELLDNWKANLVRFDLWSWATADGRVQWQSVTQDASYLADIKNTVTHMTSKSGVYVMVTVFLDPSIKPNNSDPDSEWPTAQTIPVYQALAGALYDDPKVLFALTNEPHGPDNMNAELAQRYLDSIDAIRAVEKQHNAGEHIVVVQAPQGWSRFLDYFVQNPIQRTNVAYEVHVYNPQSDFDRMLTQPHKTLPILVGEHGPNPYGTDADIQALWQLCQQLEIPHIAWTFHMRCDPNLLQDTASDGCGLSASTGYNFPRTSWGDMLHTYLATPW